MEDRQQGLGDRQRANKIHFQLMTKAGEREVLDRTRRRSACVVDQPVHRTKGVDRCRDDPLR